MAGRFLLPTDNSAGFEQPAMGLIYMGNPTWSGGRATIQLHMGWQHTWGMRIQQGASVTTFSCRVEVRQNGVVVHNQTYGSVSPGVATYTCDAPNFVKGDYYPDEPTGLPGNRPSPAGSCRVNLTNLPPGSLTLYPKCACDTPQIDGGGTGTFSYGEGYRVSTGSIPGGTITPPEPDQLIVTQGTVGEHNVIFSHNLRRAGADYRDTQYTVGVWDVETGTWVVRDVGTNASNRNYTGLRHDYPYTWQFRCYNRTSGSELTALRKTFSFRTRIDTAELWWVKNDNGETQRGFLWWHNSSSWQKSKITYVFTESGWKRNRNNLDKQ